MMAAHPAPRRRPRSRKCRVSRERLTLVRVVAVRSVARRQSIPTGQPGALSWDLTPWQDDDAAWFATSVHPGGLTLEQVATLMGISPTRVCQIEVEAIEKLRIGLEAAFDELELDIDIERAERELGIVLEPEDFLLGMFELLDSHRRAESERAVTEPVCDAACAL